MGLFLETFTVFFLIISTVIILDLIIEKIRQSGLWRKKYFFFAIFFALTILIFSITMKNTTGIFLAKIGSVSFIFLWFRMDESSYYYRQKSSLLKSSTLTDDQLSKFSNKHYLLRLSKNLSKPLLPLHMAPWLLFCLFDVYGLLLYLGLYCYRKQLTKSYSFVLWVISFIFYFAVGLFCLLLSVCTAFGVLVGGGIGATELLIFPRCFKLPLKNVQYFAQNYFYHFMEKDINGHVTYIGADNLNKNTITNAWPMRLKNYLIYEYVYIPLSSYLISLLFLALF